MSKKLIIPISLFAFAVLAASAFTFVHLSQAQTATNSTAAPSGIFGRWHGKMTPPITGTVASVSGNIIQLTSSSTTYSVDAGSAKIIKIANNSKATIQVSGISAGDQLTVVGSVNGSSITAKQIIDGTLPPMPSKTPPAASGSITAINGNIITINSNGATYTVDAGSSAFNISKSGVSVQNSGFVVGDSVTVFGSVNGSSITATRILDGSLKNGMFGRMRMGM